MNGIIIFMNFCLLGIFFLFSSLACSSAKLQWNHKGSVSRGANVLQIELDNFYAVFPVDSGIFLGGYKVDEQGVNSPYIAYVDSNMSHVKYWERPSSLKQFFQYQGRTYFLDENGVAFFYENENWQKSEFIFKPGSVIIYSGEFFIACKSAPLMKASVELGSCYSPQKKWSVVVSWSGVKPTICNQRLTVVEDRASEVVARQFDMENGRLLVSKSINSTKVDDVCSIF